MAGGRGERLGPVTDSTPKPLVRLGDQPIIEIIVRQLRASGFDRVTVCVSYLGEMIETALGNGRRFGVAIEYCWDEEPLGTAAPLMHVPRWSSPALVMNADILTSADLAAMFTAHVRSGSLLTLAARRIGLPVGFGVLDIANDGTVTGIREKPEFAVDVAAGIQVVEPEVRSWITAGAALDMPDLASALIEQERRVHACRLSAPWYDIGTPAGYRAAAGAFTRNPAEFLAPPATCPPAGQTGARPVVEDVSRRTRPAGEAKGPVHA